MRNGNFKKNRVSEICVKRIRSNQELVYIYAILKKFTSFTRIIKEMLKKTVKIFRKSFLE